ncbi:MAG: VOC family protein [Cytophagales bacterium]|nr:VOC family protein [Cytophagales bacterium]
MRSRIAIASLLILVIVSCNNNNQHQAISPRVNHVMLYVSDLEKSIQFYTQAFDFEVTNWLDTLIATQPDGTELVRPVKMAFLKFPNQDFVFELSEQVADTTNRPVAFLFQHVGIDVQDIDAAFSRAMGAGAEALLPVRVVKAKGIEAKQAFVGGPDGERVELMQIMAGEF